MVLHTETRLKPINQLDATRLLVFSDDWGRHPSSCQHLIRTMLSDVQVTWVNTIGMRPPRLDLLTLRRGTEKVRGWIGRPREMGDESAATESPPEGLTVIDSKMWPWMSHRWDRWLNRILLERQLSSAADGAVAVTTIPIVADLVGRLPVSRWIYYCVDDFSVWPGLDGETLGRMEHELLQRVDSIVAASDSLAERIRRRGRQASVLTHGVDLAFWQEGREVAEIDSPLGQMSEEKPWIVFWGVVDRRLNADWLLALADRLDQGTILLVGPQQDPDPRFFAKGRVVLPGPVPYESLPAIAGRAATLIMPYADLPVTRAMQPLKLKEYLATGRPVVAAPLPAVDAWRDCLDTAESAEAFVELTRRRSDGTVPQTQRQARERLTTESWTEKARRFRELLEFSAGALSLPSAC